MPCPPKEELQKRLSKVYKSSKAYIVVYGLRTIFGGGKTRGFVLVYDTLEHAMLYEPKFRLIRVRSMGCID